MSFERLRVCTCTAHSTSIGSTWRVPLRCGNSAARRRIPTRYCFPFTTSDESWTCLGTSRSSLQNPVSDDPFEIVTGDVHTGVDLVRRGNLLSLIDARLVQHDLEQKIVADLPVDVGVSLLLRLLLPPRRGRLCGSFDDFHPDRLRLEFLPSVFDHGRTDRELPFRFGLEDVAPGDRGRHRTVYELHARRLIRCR